MADTSAYSTADDLLLGDIPLPGYLSPERYVTDAAKEIDSKIGFLYVTPVDLSAQADPQVSRPVRLLLQRINNFLASGRLLLAINSGNEDSQAHAYGLYLVNDATLALAQIASGEIPLDIPKVPGAGGADKVTAPLLSNLDPESNVEAFYDRIVNPNFSFGPLGGNGVIL